MTVSQLLFNFVITQRRCRTSKLWDISKCKFCLLRFLLVFGLKTVSKLRNAQYSSKNTVYRHRLGWVPTLHVLIAVPMKVQIFWVITWYLLVKSFRHFGGPCCLHVQGVRCTRRADILNSEGGGKKLFRNFDNLESIYTACLYILCCWRRYCFSNCLKHFFYIWRKICSLF
jgi:hypothetical protein